jgi:hypothetical protein
MLVLWGAMLLDPLRAGLRVCTLAAIWLIPGDGSVVEAVIQPSGDWSLRLPMPPAIARLPRVQHMFGHAAGDAAPIRVRSLKLVIERKYPVLFTAGLPFYWALILASGRLDSGWARPLRALLKGSAELFVIAALSLVFYIISTAIKNTHILSGGPLGFLFDAGDYLAINVVPYLAPLLLALYLGAGLRALIFAGNAFPRHGSTNAGDIRLAPSAAVPGSSKWRARARG